MTWSSGFNPGLGMYLGSPCELTCNNKLPHVFCDQISRHCECEKKYPVRLGDEKGCAKRVSVIQNCCIDRKKNNNTKPHVKPAAYGAGSLLDLAGSRCSLLRCCVGFRRGSPSSSHAASLRESRERTLALLSTNMDVAIFVPGHVIEGCSLIGSPPELSGNQARNLSRGTTRLSSGRDISDVIFQQPVRLGDQCFYHETCLFTDQHARCRQINHNAICQCEPGYHTVALQKADQENLLL
ncbi:unnamed protein product [Timema podura]|uniref:EB domain-containing protein n=1 Tax=Timema podura TaxID=61482 RepID=A0ABN7NLS1_TIMPD|nr:unnamed protein product [Timema podura]